jgi:glucose/arabinose dehydrogenase
VVRRQAFAAPLVAAFLLSAMFPAPAMAVAPTLKTSVIQDGLAYPWDVDFAPGGQMFVTERPGRVRVFNSAAKDSPLLATTTLSGVRAEGEAGVMGIAVDPGFSTNRYVYVCLSRTYEGKWLNQVIRYRVTAGWTLEHSRYMIRTGMKANTIHNGCAVEIGPDNKLWVSMGDANQEHLAQKPTRRNGKIMRLNRDGSIPSDNPIMPGTTKRTIVYSMGHRNPQGIAFHPSTGRVYAIEHGPNVHDEINWIRPGRNYGWPCVTGYGTSYHPWVEGCGANGPFSNPAWASAGGTIATSGAAFVNGSKWQEFRGQLFVSQLKERDLRRFSISSTGTPATHQATYYDGRWGRLRASHFGYWGRLYLTTSNGSNDKVIRITPVPN